MPAFAARPPSPGHSSISARDLVLTSSLSTHTHRYSVLLEVCHHDNHSQKQRHRKQRDHVTENPSPHACGTPPSDAPTAESSVPLLRTHPTASLSRTTNSHPHICPATCAHFRIHAAVPDAWSERERLPRYLHEPFSQRPL